MDDRKLLTLAAKTIGYVNPSDDDDIWQVEHTDMHRQWNALDFDDDAFALMVKHHIIVTFTGAAGPGVSAGRRMGPFFNEVLPDKIFGLDEDRAATRRAIVRAAAAIGEQMP